MQQEEYSFPLVPIIQEG